MHTRVTRYELKPGRKETCLELVRNHWIDSISSAEGFISFEMLASDSDELIGILSFETREQSFDALETAKKWIFQNFGDHLASPSIMYMGDVKISTKN